MGAELSVEELVVVAVVGELLGVVLGTMVDLGSDLSVVEVCTIMQSSKLVPILGPQLCIILIFSIMRGAKLISSFGSELGVIRVVAIVVCSELVWTTRSHLDVAAARGSERDMPVALLAEI